MLNLLLLIGIPLALFIVSWRFLRKGNNLTPLKRRIWEVIGVVSLLPAVFFLLVIFWFIATNFPFTSSIAAHASAPTGEEACVLQTFEGADGYAVRLYARAAGSPWVSHYLAYEDGRWRDCRLEFKGRELFVYEGGALRKIFMLPEATALPKEPAEQIPSNYTPEQILQKYNSK